MKTEKGVQKPLVFLKSRRKVPNQVNRKNDHHTIPGIHNNNIIFTSLLQAISRNIKSTAENFTVPEIHLLDMAVTKQEAEKTAGKIDSVATKHARKKDQLDSFVDAWKCLADYEDGFSPLTLLCLSPRRIIT